jgi:trans-aconitate methyltransferase
MYDTYGPDGYYQQFAADYDNPHLPEIKALLEKNLYRLDTTAVLDLAAGTGEVTQVLLEHGITDVQGIDPYTYIIYTEKTGRPCTTESFMDILKDGLDRPYSLIVCSFAMHLCPLKDLFSLTWQLFQSAPVLVIITPHKRPELELLPGIELLWTDETETIRGKKVRMKAYQPAT